MDFDLGEDAEALRLRLRALIAEHIPEGFLGAFTSNPKDLDVTQAFYDALLSDRLVAIAELAYAQASAAYEQAKQSVAAGRQPEFEQLRAEVTRDNQRPLVIRRKAEREVAYLRLRQLAG